MKRLQIAYFSPLPPARSGIADYSRELLPHLSDHADITVFSDESQKVDDDLTKEFTICPIRQYPIQRWQYHIPLYQMGNNAHHEAMYQMFLRYPGIITLHDYSLHHFVSYCTVGRNHFAGYVRELGYERGRQGIEQARKIRLGEQSPSLYGNPLNRRLLDLSLGLIVHSHYAQDLTLAQKPKLDVKVIPQQITRIASKSCRHKLPWPKNAIIFASAGQITAAKQVDFALRAFKKVQQAIPNSYYLVIGDQMDDVDLTGIIRSLDLSDNVWLTGHITDKQEFINWISTADIIVNLRYPTVGETSRIALRALATKRPLIVYDHGWYSEIPDDASIKIQPNDEEALVAAMESLAGSTRKRKCMGDASLAYIQQVYDPAHIARQHIEFINNVLARKKCELL